MLKRIVMQLNGLIMAQFIRLWALVATRLWRNAKPLLVNYTLSFLNAVKRLFKLVQTALNINRLRVSLIIAAVSIKAVCINVLRKAIPNGQPPQTIAPQTNQPAVSAQLLKRGKPAASTKSAQSHSSGTLSAPTLTEPQLTRDGAKSKGRAKRHKQRAKQAFKKGN